MREARERAAHIKQAQAVHVASKPAKQAQTTPSPSSKSYQITTLVSPNRSNAEVFAAALRKRGYNVHTERVGSGWAVQSPTYHSKSEADTTAHQLQKSGYTAGISN
jgi:cell division septation protein DedD